MRDFESLAHVRWDCKYHCRLQPERVRVWEASVYRHVGCGAMRLTKREVELGLLLRVGRAQGDRIGMSGQGDRSDSVCGIGLDDGPSPMGTIGTTSELQDHGAINQTVEERGR
jgi:hypothetical protein